MSLYGFLFGLERFRLLLISLPYEIKFVFFPSPVKIAVFFFPFREREGQIYILHRTVCLELLFNLFERFYGAL